MAKNLYERIIVSLLRHVPICDPITPSDILNALNEIGLEFKDGEIVPIDDKQEPICCNKPIGGQIGGQKPKFNVGDIVVRRIPNTKESGIFILGKVDETNLEGYDLDGKKFDLDPKHCQEATHTGYRMFFTHLARNGLVWREYNHDVAKLSIPDEQPSDEPTEFEKAAGANAVLEEIIKCLPNTPSFNPNEVLDIITSKIKQLKK